MLTILSAWRFIVRRAQHDWLVLTVLASAVLLTTTLFSTGPLYADSVATASARRALADAPEETTTLTITGSGRAASAAAFADLDRHVRSHLQHALGGLTGTVLRSGQSGPMTLPMQPLSSATAITTLGFRDNLPAHATLTAGRWPTDGQAALDVVIHEAAAAQLGVTVGAELVITARQDNTTFHVVVVGTYRPNTQDDVFWGADPLAQTGVEIGSSFARYGPFMTTPAAFAATLADQPTEVVWRALPSGDQLTIADIDDTPGRIRALETRLNAQQLIPMSFTVTTDLGTLVADIQQGLLAARVGVIILALQLTLLAGYALVVTTGLVLTHRRNEMTLLQSRGAGSQQIMAMTAIEALFITIPAAIAAPWLGALALRSLNTWGPLAAIGLQLQPTVTGTALVLAGGGALLCVALLLIPTFLTTRSLHDRQASSARESSLSWIQHSGIDVALLALAAIGYLQLRRYAIPLIETVQGHVAIDPFLVAAPTLGLIAGALCALRLVPIAVRLGELLVRRQRRIILPMSIWQLARRPTRYARSMLLLMLAVALGVFTVAYAQTWHSSQADQANYQIGADLRVQPEHGPRAIPQEHVAAAYQSVPGLNASMAVSRGTAELTSDWVAQTVFIDTAQASSIVHFRGDLAAEPFHDLMMALSTQRPNLAGIPLPGEPESLNVVLRASFPSLDYLAPPDDAIDTPSPRPPAGPAGFSCQNTAALPNDTPVADLGVPLAPALVLQDATGNLFRIQLQPLNADGSIEERTLALRNTLPDGTMSLPAYPLSVVSMEFATTIPPLAERCGTFELLALQVHNTDTPDQAENLLTAGTPRTWEFAFSPIVDSTTQLPPRVARVSGAAADHPGLNFSTGATKRNLNAVFPAGSRITFSLRPSGSTALSALPAIVSQDLLAETGLTVGATLPTRIDGRTRSVEIVGTLNSFPTVGPDSGTLLVVDRQTDAILRLALPGDALPAADEYWLSVDPLQTEQVAATLAAPPYSAAAVLSATKRERELSTNPTALSMLGGLTIGVVAALIFAASGMLTNAAIAARERLLEFALLRALGLSTRQLASWLLLENGLLIAISLLAGTGLGLLLSWLILPFIAVSSDATRVYPGVIVLIPWPRILLLELAVVLVLLVLSSGLTIALRRIGLGAVLRAGGE